MANDKQPVERQFLFDKPANVQRLLRLLYGSCAVLLALEFFIHRHVVHSWENLWGFYPLYGFAGCVLLVLIASWMRTFLKRPEDYYDSKNSGDVAQQKTNKAGDDHVDA